MLIKEPGEPKETHEGQMVAALPVFDVHSYVEDFAATIMPAYRAGTADRGSPSTAASPAASSRPGRQRRATFRRSPRASRS